MPKGELRPKLLLSTDTLWGYGLDMIFKVAKEVGFDWIDLAVWKVFDSWNIDYVKTLSKEYDFPVESIQVSSNINRKEVNHAVEIARELEAKTIVFNAPVFYNFRAFKFVKDNIAYYKKSYRNIEFCMLNPPKSNLLAVFPTHHFSNIGEIIKKYKFFLWLDVSNVNEDSMELDLIRKLPNIVPYIGQIYLSDKSKYKGSHRSLGDGTLKIPAFLKKLKKLSYMKNFCIKLDMDKKELVDMDKIKIILKKNVIYYKEFYEDLELR